MFKLTVKALDKIETIDEKSIVIKFCIDDDNLNKAIADFLKKNRTKINSVQKEKFLSKEESELILAGKNDTPYLSLLKKVKIDKKFDNDFFRDYISSLIIRYENEPVKNLYIEIPDFILFEKYFADESYYHQTFIEGLYLGNYAFNKYKSDRKESKKLNVFIVSKSITENTEAIRVAENIMNAVYLSRNLINEIPDFLTPQELAKQAKVELIKLGVNVKLFIKQQLQIMGMWGISSVGKASINPPLLIVIEYKPKTKAKAKVTLVGKGVTYDAGGLSLKTTSGMVEMKADMAGAGVVIGAIKAAALEKLPIHIIGVIPAVENVISGSAYKPSDIIRTASGKTIEVMDTDAEGRIILADALYYACKQKPDYVIDYATLTGAVVVALGEFAAGLFSNDETLAEDLLKASKITNEKLWQFPMWDEYNTLIKGDLADVKNLGGKWGGAITAAKFLEHFVDENQKWAHLDIAGPSIKYKLKSYTEKYNTGYAVRLTYQYLKELSK
ncbi:MAG: leucyl aminopeptidase [bacterium]